MNIYFLFNLKKLKKKIPKKINLNKSKKFEKKESKFQNKNFCLK